MVEVDEGVEREDEVEDWLVALSVGGWLAIQVSFSGFIGVGI